MSNVFLQNQDYAPAVKRNPYDLGRLNNATFRSGLIYPIGWDEVTFGDSIRLRISAGLRTLPMPWPLQTPVIAKFYTFYVRYRTLQKNFTDFRFGNKSIVHPYIAYSSDSDFWKTGGLGDYLGIPTTYASSTNLHNLGLYSPMLGQVSPKNYPVVYSRLAAFSTSLGTDFLSSCSYSKESLESYRHVRFVGQNISDSFLESGSLFLSEDLFNMEVVTENPRLFVCILNDKGTLIAYQVISDFHSLIDGDKLKLNLTTGSVSIYNSTSVDTGIKGAVNFMRSVANPVLTPEFLGDYFLCIADYYELSSVISSGRILNDTTFTSNNAENLFYYDLGAGIHELKDVNNPFAGVSPEIPLTSLPVRAYEACYRSHFQDLINEPFVIDGEPQYNRYITNDGDGADTAEVPLFHRNWEADRFTSCKPSPQQGMAPIVGVNSSGDIVLQRSDGTDIEYHVTFDKDGVADGFIERYAGQANGDTTIKRRLLDLATTGFTINSLRDVNSYQRWKEAVYRKSPKFKDQVRSVFGVNLEYKELDMPEFLGGFDILLNVSEITQTSSSVEGSPLGDLAGRGAFSGRAKHEISHYCDEEGIVMTLMCITPIPVYSQMLDRKWLKSTPLDYYNPQFGKIGNQAITYEEVCPVQAYNEGVDVHDVFGYQRPWYQYISSYDEVHGLFRNSMNGFVWQRVFGSTPELGKDFLHIDESQLNQVFIAGQGQDDTFYGQINYDCDIKRGIPRQIVSSLE